MSNQARRITVDTKLIALLGNPLRQSVSYLTQNQVYEELGLDYCYFPVELPRADQLESVIAGFREMNFAGFAVTKPYKEQVLPYLDRLDSTAEKMGACNTVVVEDGCLVGYNTDGIGCTRSLREERGFEAGCSPTAPEERPGPSCSSWRQRAQNKLRWPRWTAWDRDWLGT